MNWLRNVVSRLKTFIFTTYVKHHLKQWGENLRVNEFSHISGNVILGSNVNFNGMRIVVGNGKIVIGNNFHSGHNCQIIASIHNYDRGNAIPYDSTFVDKNVFIEDNVWIGNNVIILGNVILGEGCIVQAGAVVVKNVPPYAIAGGNPAKVFKYRNVEHYLELKKKNKVH